MALNTFIFLKMWSHCEDIICTSNFNYKITCFECGQLASRERRKVMNESNSNECMQNKPYIYIHISDLVWFALVLFCQKKKKNYR